MKKKRQWLIDARKEKNIRQFELAAQAEIAKSYLSSIESGERTPSGVTALRIAKIIGQPMERFYEDLDPAEK